MKKIIKNNFSHLLILLLSLITLNVKAQAVPQGINYQGLARNSAGNVMINQALSLKVGIYSPTITGVLEWEEVHSITTNQLGLFYIIVGQGISTGAGTKPSFSTVSWGSTSHFIKIAMDETGGSAYVNIDTIQFWSVPYAMYSAVSDSVNQPMRLSQLSDVDTIGVFLGATLKWNGAKWIPAIDKDSDTVSFANNTAHSINSDTAAYAVNVLSVIDTILFSHHSDSASFAVNSNLASNAINSKYCDTAAYALNSGSTYSYWNLTGNTGTTPATDFIGTIDNKDFILKTNSIERMRITSGGKIGIGTSAPSATLHVVGDDGVVAEGTFGTGAIPPSGAGTRMVWYPKKAAFRAGGVSGAQWDDINIGNYSFASGNNNKASGAYATAFGSGSIASGQYSLAACELSTASGISSVAMGSACIASGPYSIALGRGTTASDSSSVAIGYHNTATGKYGLSFGYQTRASGDYSTAFGFWASANGKRGSFIFADGSSSVVTNCTADNQFMVRASGGVIFYSNTALTAGVSLPAGGGSWASVSDKNKKEHFRKESPNAILSKLNKLEITSWNYKTQPPYIRHIGPMAQDLYKVFNFGESDTTITSIDIDGISLIAIQALSLQTKELLLKADEVKKLTALVNKLELENKMLEKRISGMEQKLNIPRLPLTVSINSTDK